MHHDPFLTTRASGPNRQPPADGRAPHDWPDERLAEHTTSTGALAAAPADGLLRLGPPLRVFFDVDGTLITWNSRLRPYARAVLARLHARGHAVYLWSGWGARHEVAEQHALYPFLQGLFGKPLYDFEQRMARFTDIRPDIIIDDHPEIVQALGGIQVRPAVEPFEGDREMLRVYRAVLARERQRPRG